MVYVLIFNFWYYLCIANCIDVGIGIVLVLKMTLILNIVICIVIDICIGILMVYCIVIKTGIFGTDICVGDGIVVDIGIVLLIYPYL